MDKLPVIRVVQLQRRRWPDGYSLEGQFESLRSALPPDIQCDAYESRYFSRGFLPRAYNCLEASLRQGAVTHVTGDVHYLTYFLQRKRTILTVHDCGGMERLTGLQHYAFRLLWLKIPVLRSSAITAISEFTRSELSRHTGCSPDRIRVIPVPLLPGFMFAKKRFNRSRPTILLLGVTPNKNLHRCAAALRGIPCQVRIIGHVSRDQDAAFSTTGLNYEIREKLSRDEIILAYQQADMLLFPSTYEGFGMPIIEAQASGRAVVTSNLAAMPEVAGSGACLVDPFNVESIRQGVVSVIEDSQYRERLVESGLVNVHRFSVESIAAQYADLYREVAREM